jgi:hypothetical protein
MTIPVVSGCVRKGIVGYCVGKVSGFLPSLVPQSDHSVDFHRPPRGNVTSESSNGDKNHRHDCERERISWLDTVKQVRQEACQHECADDSDGLAD